MEPVPHCVQSEAQLQLLRSKHPLPDPFKAGLQSQWQSALPLQEGKHDWLVKQIWPLGQVPQSSVPLQPSEMLPHVLPWAAQLVGVQPQTLGVPGLPPPQLFGAAQAPQFRSGPPQPFGMLPQFLP